MNNKWDFEYWWGGNDGLRHSPNKRNEGSKGSRVVLIGKHMIPEIFKSGLNTYGLSLQRTNQMSIVNCDMEHCTVEVIINYLF